MFAEFSIVQKRALFKLAMDLVKIDHQIHNQEVLFLGDLQRKCNLSDEELDLVRYITLQESIEILQTLAPEIKKGLCGFLESLISVDNNTDIKEKILLSAIKLSLCDESNAWNKVISVKGREVEYTSQQIVYLEKSRQESVYDCLKNDYVWMLLVKSFNDVGLQFFYLPKEVSDLKKFLKKDVSSSGVDLLQSLQLFFNKKHLSVDNIGDVLDDLTVESFSKVILSSYDIIPETLPEGFLLLRIQEEYVADDEDDYIRIEDFLCIDVSRDLMDRTLYFINSLENPICAISYDGYYKYLFDYVCLGSKIMSAISLDEKYNFYLKDLSDRLLKFESSPQSRTFYLLLLKYGSVGISQDLFDSALAYLADLNVSGLCLNGDFDLEKFKISLLESPIAHSLLIYNAICIYEALSTKDAYAENFLSYITNIFKYRSSLKNYINNTFMNIRELSDSSQYCVHFDKTTKSYFIGLNLSYFLFKENHKHISLSDSCLWNKLK